MTNFEIAAKILIFDKNGFYRPQKLLISPKFKKNFTRRINKLKSYTDKIYSVHKIKFR